MLSSSVSIEAIAYELAPERVTSLELEAQIADTMKRLGVPKGRIEQLTGIRERGFFPKGTKPSDAATLAAEKVINKSGIPRDEIGVIINCSVSRDYVEPSTACLIHGNLGLSEYCRNFDLTNACLGFIDGINTAQLMIESGQVKYALLTGAETVRDGIEATIKRLQKTDSDMNYFFNNFASLTLGSGAAAVILAHKDVSKNQHIINGSVSMAATQHNRLCIAYSNDEMITDAQALLIGGIELAGKTWKLAEQNLPNWSTKTIDAYVPHQISQRHVDKFAETLNIPKKKIKQNLFTNGNVAPVGLITTLAMAEENGEIKKDDHVALMGIGSGINCTMMSVTW
ncbi:MAG: 3-oxoacyl-ACP synthase III [Anaerolineales bacterium]|nr:3-oxoacyl-ACP synthase III [Anaerolineales bacterium]